MSNKSFLGLIIVIFGAIGGFIYFQQSNKPAVVELGVKHANLGQEHISQGQKHAAYNSSPATSGPHRSDAGAPVPWGVYVTELDPEVYIHNLEHGGILVTYKPDLPADQIKKLQDLFVPPYSDSTFKPNKTIVMPRAANTKAIQMAAWTKTYDLDTVDVAKLKTFYLQTVGKAPESAAGPTNTPINQAANR